MKKIQIVTNLCVDNNANVLGGGVERWSWEISCLLRENGFEVYLYQRSSKNFSITKEGIITTGLNVKEGFVGNFAFTAKLNKIIDINTLTLFVSHELMLFSKVKHAIGVNHGNWWNGDISFSKKVFVRLIQKYLLKKSSSIICVDTNYINWCLDNLSNRVSYRHKLFYIPNYADTNLFSFKDRKTKIDGTYTIMYPRRLNFQNIDENPRGLGLYLKAIKILENSTDYKFHYKFVGRGEKLKGELRNVLGKMKIGAERFTIKDVSPNEMPMEYKNTDIVVIPTLAQEGTSFSAIESISSGCITIVTYIGGLPNIVLDGFNGFISNLDPATFASKIILGIENIEKINGNCLIARDLFSKDIWAQKILKLIEDENKKTF